MKRNDDPDYVIGVISDTHGTVRPSVLELFEGADLIVHAGDVGKPDVLDALGSVASVIAVRGNMDRDEWSQNLPVTKVVEVRGVMLYTLHDLTQLDFDPAAAGFGAVISGHTHRASIHRKQGVLYVNPGCSGSGSGSRPPTVALLRLGGRGLDAEVVELED